MRRTTNGLAVVLVGALLATGCTAGDEGPADRATTDEVTGVDEPGGDGDDGPGHADATGGETTDNGATDDAAADAADGDREGFSTEEQAGTTGRPGTLVAVTAEATGDVDTVRFEFDGDLPSYRVGYVERLLLGEDEVVDVEGDASLEVAFEESTPGPDGTTSAEVPTNEAYDLAAVRQVLLLENLGGAVTFGVGVTDEVAFRVVEDDEASTLVVELEHP